MECGRCPNVMEEMPRGAPESGCEWCQGRFCGHDSRSCGGSKDKHCCPTKPDRGRKMNGEPAASEMKWKQQQCCSDRLKPRRSQTPWPRHLKHLGGLLETRAVKLQRYTLCTRREHLRLSSEAHSEIPPHSPPVRRVWWFCCRQHCSLAQASLHHWPPRQSCLYRGESLANLSPRRS